VFLPLLAAKSARFFFFGGTLGVGRAPGGLEVYAGAVGGSTWLLLYLPYQKRHVFAFFVLVCICCLPFIWLP